MKKINKRAEAMMDIISSGEDVARDNTTWWCEDEDGNGCFKHNDDLIYDSKDVMFAFKMLRTFVWQYRKKHSIK